MYYILSFYFQGLNGLINIGSKIISVKDPNLSIAIRTKSSVFSYKTNDENVIIQAYVEHGVSDN